MSRERVGSTPRFEFEHGPEFCQQNRLCAECGDQLRGRRRRWCSDDCVNSYMIRANPSWARQCVLDRDKGVCADCGLDTLKIQREVKNLRNLVIREYKTRTGQTRHLRWRSRGYLPSGLREELDQRVTKHLLPHGLETWPRRKTFWDMDHIVPVHRGGGEPELIDLQTLCLKCHEIKTQKQARNARRRGPKRIARMPSESCECGSSKTLCDGCVKYRIRVKKMSRG